MGRRRLRVLRGVLRRRRGQAGLALLAFVIFVAFYGQFLDPYAVRAYPCIAVCNNLPPFEDISHPFGTYPNGQDVFSEIAHGAASDLFIGFAATTIALGIGIPVGAGAGLGRGPKGALALGVTQVFLIIPSFAVIVWFYRSFGTSNLFGVPLNVFYLAVLLGLFAWPPVAMVTRNEVLRSKEEEYVQGARALGARNTRLVFRHMLPNIVAPLIGVAGILFAANITAEALFTYLGLVNPNSDVVTWGYLIWEGQRLLTGDWWVSFFPGLMLVFTTFGVILVADVLADELNPKLRA